MKRHLIWTLALVLASVGFASAQEQFSTITGTAMDETGAPIPGATVTLTNLSTKRTFTRTTDADGNYFAREVEPGRYSVRFELTGFSTVEVADVNLLLGKTLRIPATLKVGTVTETVQVVGESPLIDVGSTLRGANVPSEEFDKIPKGRSFESLATALPSVNSGALEGGIQVNGASAAENSFTVDGVAVNSLLSGAQRQDAVFEHLAEVQVKTSGISAEYGGALGGVISAVTKTGGNSFKGSVVYYYTSDALTSTSDLQQRQVLDPITQNKAYYVQDTAQSFDRHEVGLSLGGPIMKDKLWFFASTTQAFEDRSRDYQLATGPVTGKRSGRNQSNFGKLTWQANKLRINVSGLSTPQKNEGTLAGFDGTLANFSTQSAAGVEANNIRGFKIPQWQVAGTLDYTLSNTTLLSIRTGYFHDGYEATGINTAQTYEYSSSSVGLAGVPAQFQHPAGYSNLPRVSVDDHDTTIQKFANLELTTVAHAAGTHNLKLGGGLRRASNDVQLAYPNGGYVTVFWDQAFVNDATGVADRGTYGFYQIDDFGTVGKTGSDVVHLFLQDSWQVSSRLSVDLGLRAEKENIPTFRPDIKKNFIEWGFGDKLAPRLGAAYDLKGDGKTKISGSYGRYYDWTRYELARGSTGGDIWTQRFRSLDNPDPTLLSRAALTGRNLWTSEPDSSKDLRVPSLGDDGVDANIKPMSVDHYNVGFEHQFAGNTVFGVNYIHTKLNRTIEDTGTLINGSEVYIECNPGEGRCANANVSSALATSTFAMPTAKRKYDALEVTLNRRFSGNWFLGGSYVFSRLWGNYAGTSNTDEFSLGGRVSRVSQQQAGQRTRPGSNAHRGWDLDTGMWDAHGNLDVVGNLATDRPHVVKLYGSKAFRFGTNVGVNFYAGSGTPVTKWVGHFVPMAVDGRGSLGRTPFLNYTNLFLSHDIKLGEKGRLMRFEFNALNLFNQKQARHIFDQLNRIGANGRTVSSSRPNVAGVDLAAGYDYLALLAATPDAQKPAGSTAAGYQDPRFLSADEFNPGFQGRLSVRFIF